MNLTIFGIRFPLLAYIFSTTFFPFTVLLFFPCSRPWAAHINTHIHTHTHPNTHLFADLRVVHVRVCFANHLPPNLRPHHERIHRPFDVRRWFLAVCRVGIRRGRVGANLKIMVVLDASIKLDKTEKKNASAQIRVQSHSFLDSKRYLTLWKLHLNIFSFIFHADNFCKQNQ